MKRPAIYSALIHLLVLLFLTIGFYNPFQKAQVVDQPLMVEFVQIDEQSAAPQITPQARPEEIQQPPEPPKPAPPPPPPLPQPPEPQPAKPEPQKPEPMPEPPLEAIPDPIAPKEKPREEKKVPPEKTPKEKPPKESPPKKQKAEITLDQKKKPPKQKEEAKKPSKNFDDLLNEIESADDGAPTRGKGAPASRIGPVITASEKDALSQHMRKCWIIPAGIRDAKDMRVPIKLKLARDGTVLEAKIMDTTRMTREPSYRSAAESARRAVLNPKCSPLPIPLDKYDQFKEFIFNFDPKEMF
jgi:outer membrane biosynthesis protein TonB